MTKLAEIAARSAKQAGTFTWIGPNATDFTSVTTVWTGDTTTKTAVGSETIDPQDESAEQAAEREAFRTEIRALPHLMPVNGGKVHYGDRFGAQNIPACRQSHGYHRISYYRAVELPVTCTVCMGRFGAEN